MKHYLMVVWGQDDPEVLGPFGLQELHEEASRIHLNNERDPHTMVELRVPEDDEPPFAYRLTPQQIGEGP